MSDPILTIGIPSYNRSDHLERLLQQFSKEDLSKFILLIVDDASPDNPTQMVQKYIKEMPNLNYIRNEENLGFSGNVCKIYDMATTPYIWFVCDDDQIMPNCIPTIINKLKEYDPTVAILNHTWVNPFGIKKTAGVELDKLYNTMAELKDYSVIMRTTFLSTLILKKAISTDEIRLTDYNNNVFIQISLSLILLTDNFRLLELSIPAIERQVGYKYGEFFKFYMVDYLRAIFAVNHNLDNKKFLELAIKEIPVAFQLYLSQKLGIFRYYGRPTLRTIKEIFIYYRFYSVIVFLFVPLYYLIPSILLKYVYKVQLNYFHGPKTAKEVYKQTINRAYTDERKTGFTDYK